jgi:hypothetical protein
MKKSTTLIVLAALACGVVIGKSITPEVIDKLNPFKDPTFDCKYQYFMPDQLKQERWFSIEKTKLLDNLQTETFIEGLKVTQVLKTFNDKEIDFMAQNSYDSFVVQCKVR